MRMENGFEYYYATPLGTARRVEHYVQGNKSTRDWLAVNLFTRKIYHTRHFFLYDAVSVHFNTRREAGRNHFYGPTIIRIRTT